MMVPILSRNKRSLLILLVSIILGATRITTALSPSSSVSRRDVIVGGGSLATGVVGSILVGGLPKEALATTSSNQEEAPIAVLGASGRTGALCVTACLQAGIPVRALTRSGSWPPEGMEYDVANSKNLLTVAACDVKNPRELQEAIAGCRAVIYAASASKKGGNAHDIDNLGVVAAAEACLQAKVGRYVVLSSTATTRPKSLGYQFTNISVGGIMEEKRKGEQGAQTVYQKNTGDSSISYSYTIVRPGGLEEPKKNIVLGPTALEISQGDTLAGIISRADLAQATVALALSRSQNVQNTAVELYYTESAQPCERRFKALLTNGVAPRLHGATYEELFAGIQPNIDYYEA